MTTITEKVTSGGANLKGPLTQDAQPIVMPRTVGKGPGGSGNSLPPNKGEYGLALGEEPTQMSRKESGGPGGNNFKLDHTGPVRMSRKDKGGSSTDAKTFGVGGVGGGAGNTYGVGGVGGGGGGGNYGTKGK